MNLAHMLVSTVCMAVGLLSACQKKLATEEDCQVILDRIIEIEAQKKGFHDLAFVSLKKADFKVRLAKDLNGCIGLSIGQDFASCLRDVSSSEQLSEQCLR
jgi:hypothetical protein